MTSNSHTVSSPALSVKVYLTVVTPTLKVLPGSWDLTTVAGGPEKTVAEGSVHDTSAESFWKGIDTLTMPGQSATTGLSPAEKKENPVIKISDHFFRKNSGIVIQKIATTQWLKRQLGSSNTTKGNHH